MPWATTDNLKILSGSAHPELAAEVAHHLGLTLDPVVRKSFADGETYIQIQESVRGCDVFLVQPTCNPVNNTIMELLIMIDACHRASARQISAVIPYYGYARADRKTAGREAITSKLVANLLVTAGVHRILALDLHCGQIQAFFDVPCDHISAQPVLAAYIDQLLGNDVVVVSPDVGGVARARAFAKRLKDAPLAIIDKRRLAHNEVEIMNVIGDVKGRTAVLVDDMIDTAGTITQGAQILLDSGAKQVYACATHAVFSGKAVNRLSQGPLTEVVVANTIPLPDTKQFPKLRVLSVAGLIGEAIWRIHTDHSISSMLG